MNCDLDTSISFYEEEIVIKSGQWNLSGTLTIPKKQIPDVAVVLIHGSGAQDRDASTGDNKPFRDIAFGLASFGIAVLRYEKRTWRYSKELLSLPDITANEDVVDDAISAIHLLHSLTKIDCRRIFLLGHSLGGMLLPKIVNRIGNIAGLILLAAPSRPFEDVLLSQAFYIYQMNKDEDILDFQQEQFERIKEQIINVKKLYSANNYSSSNLPLGYPASYWIDLKNYNLTKNFGGLDCPMFILQGERDYQVTMEDFYGWQEFLANKQGITFKSYPSLNHLFIKVANDSFCVESDTHYKNVDKKVIFDISRWIKFASSVFNKS